MTDQTPALATQTSYANSEAQFRTEELFYSRTDRRGVIAAGNTVFQRVAAFPWEELSGAPHRIIRHPDMPKGVFQLLWDRIKDGRPTGAYVKNRCKTGAHYWVFALVSPSEGGYISTRLKPTSDLFGAVRDLYGGALAREQSERLSPAASAAAILEDVRGHGFDSYDAFQSHALSLEYASRATLLRAEMAPPLKRFRDMSAAIAQVHEQTAEMTEAFQAIRTIPMNMRIIASRLENAGGPISAISVNYSQVLEEMTTWVSTFVEGEACVFARIRDAILTGQFLAFASAVEAEMAEVFRQEAAERPDAYPDTIRPTEEIAEIERHREMFKRRTIASLTDVEREAKRFGRSVLDMKRYVTGLSSTRMMCKIESAALNNSGTALAGIVEQLDACQDEIERGLARIVELNALVQNNTAMLRMAI